METIAWDVDDVLNDLMRAWFDQTWRVSHPGCRLHYEEIVENPPHRLLDAPLTDYLASLDAYRRDGAYARLAPVREVLAWFQSEGPRYRHLALTSVPLAAAPVSAEWVLRHFGRWIRSFHFIPSPREGESLPIYDQGKAEFLQRTGVASILVDDHAGNIRQAERAGLRGVLFPRPWNGNARSVGETLEALTRALETV
jgi:hypothetical protein